MVLSLFDYTGLMVEPWANAGYNTAVVDIQHEKKQKDERGILHIPYDVHNIYHHIDMNYVKMIFAFPPCTDLAVSGARHFATKQQKDPNYRKKAMELVRFTESIASHLRVPYMIENPVSVISTEWRKPDAVFHPYEYGGYLPEDDVNPISPLIPPRDAYKKKTCLWIGNGFRIPEKKPVPLPTDYQSHIHKKLGGSTLKTKNIRSATPRGFAEAVFQSNMY